MIPNVELKELTTHLDDRGFFREIIRASDPFFAGAFGQWSHSMMVTGTIKAWHVHLKQTDWWYVAAGVVRAVLCDTGTHEIQQYLLGDHHPPNVLKIPPGVAHGLKVLQGPAHLLYITSEEYNPADEGRIAYDALGYDWFREPIK